MNNSQANQAKLNNAQWLQNYREQALQVNPDVSPVDLSSNINVALRDPVNGQATATGLAAGQSLINSWIAGANANARRQANQLAHERWIKQQQDLADEHTHQRAREALEDKRYEEALQEYVPDADPVRVSPFILDPRQKAFAQSVANASNRDLKGGVARNPVEAAKMRERQQQARKRAEESLAKQKVNIGLTPEQTRQLNVSDAGDVRSNNWFTRHLPWRSDFETDLARQTGSNKYVSYDNFAQLRNAYFALNNFDAVRWLGEMERQILKNGDRVLQIVRPGNENAPTYVLTNHGSYILDPIRTEMTPVQAEVK